MRKIQPDERDFQTQVKNAWFGFKTQMHPGIGADPGIPDLWFLADIGFVPAEIKIGTIEDGILWTSTIRQAQVAWHRRLSSAGGFSMFLVGVWSGDHWRAFAVDGLYAAKFDVDGFKIGETAFEINLDNFNDDLNDFVLEFAE